MIRAWFVLSLSLLSVVPALFVGMTAMSHFLKLPAFVASGDMQQMYHWNMWPMAA